MQLGLISRAPIQNINHLEVPQPEQSDDPPMSMHLVKVGKKNSLYRKKPQGELAAGRGSHLLRLFGVEGRETGYKAHCGRKPENINNSCLNAESCINTR